MATCSRAGSSCRLPCGAGDRRRARHTIPYCPPERPRSGSLLRTILLLTASNVFMTFAWYSHLKNLSGRPWYMAALVSWGIALFEYLLQVPANRIGATTMTLPQLKMLQEAIALTVFVPFAVFYLYAAGEARFPVGRAVHPGGPVLHVSRRNLSVPPTALPLPPDPLPLSPLYSLDTVK